MLGLAIASRAYRIDAHGPYWDEIVTLHNAVGSDVLAPIPSATSDFDQRDFRRLNTLANLKRSVQLQDGGNYVLYHLFMHYWILAFGTSDLAIRAPSLLFGVLLVLAVARLGTHLMGWAAGCCAGFFAALHPLLVALSQEARGKPLAALLALGSAMLFVSIWQRKQPFGGRIARTLAFGLLSGAALLTHYFTAPLLAAQALFAVVNVRDRKAWTELVGGWLLAAAILAGWLFWGGLDGMDLNLRASTFLRERVADPSRWVNFFYPATPRFVVAGSLRLLYAMTGNDIQTTAMLLGLQLRHLLPVLLLPMTFIGLALSFAREGPPRQALLFLGLLAATAPAFSVLVALRSGHTMSLRPEYTSFATPYLLIILGTGVSHLAKLGPARRVAACLLVGVQAAIMAVGLRALYDDIYLDRARNVYLALAHRLADTVQAGEEIVYPRWFDARTVNLYLPLEPLFSQRVEGSAEGDASIRGSLWLPNTPSGAYREVPPSTEPIRILRGGLEVARFPGPKLF